MEIGKIVSDVEIIRLDELEKDDAPTESAPAEKLAESVPTR